MERPEIEPRNGVIVAWVAEVQEAQELFVDEKEPKEAMIFTRTAVQGPSKIRWIAQSRKDVPGSSDEQNDEGSADGMEFLPRPPAEELLRKVKVNQGRPYGKYYGYQTLQKKPETETDSKHAAPD